MSEWIQLPPAPLLRDTSAPHLVETSQLDEFRAYMGRYGAHLADVSIGSARDTVDVIDALKGVLAFPTWCGSGWDSIDDAFDELRSAWQFPLVLVVHGLDELLCRHPHLGLEVVLRLHELHAAFSSVRAQLVVAFVAPGWGNTPPSG